MRNPEHGSAPVPEILYVPVLFALVSVQSRVEAQRCDTWEGAKKKKN